MQKQWLVKQDSKGNKILVNPKIVYKYKDFNNSFLNELKASA